MNRILSNVTVKVNNAEIRKEKRDGRDVWIVPSKTLPRDIVMNGIMYPGEAVERSFNMLEGKPAPYGHPKVNGQFVSAMHPMAINTAWVGAYNENARYDGYRVSVDKVIDIETANQSENGRRVINAIERVEPIHTSVAVYLEVENLDEPAKNEQGQSYSQVAVNILDFDHDAILIGEKGAAKPEQGVGIFVNANGEKEEVDVLNYSITDMMEEDLEYAAMNVVETYERLMKAESRKGMVKRVIGAIKSAMGGGEEPGTTIEVNHDHEGDDMTINEEDFDALVKKVDDLATNAEKTDVTTAVTEAIQPLTEKVDALQANIDARDEAEKSDLVKTVVNAELLDEEDAKELSVNALRKLAEKAKPRQAFNMFGAPPTNNQDDGTISDELPGGDE